MFFLYSLLIKLFTVSGSKDISEDYQWLVDNLQPIFLLQYNCIDTVDTTPMANVLGLLSKNIYCICNQVPN